MLQVALAESRPSLSPGLPAIAPGADPEDATAPVAASPRRVARWLDLGLYLEAARELEALEGDAGEAPEVVYYRCLTELGGRRPHQLPSPEVAEAMRKRLGALVEGAMREGVDAAWVRPAAALWAWIEDDYFGRRGAAEAAARAERLLAFARRRRGRDDREELERLFLRLPATAQGGRVGHFLRRALQGRA